MGKPRGCGGSRTEPAEGWEGKDIDLVGVCIAGSPTANRPTKNKAVCGQYGSLMLALGNGDLQRLHLVRVVVTLSSHGTETEPRPWDISCGSLMIPELVVNIIDCDIFHTSQRAA
jgi:hypothetical protein